MQSRSENIADLARWLVARAQAAGVTTDDLKPEIRNHIWGGPSYSLDLRLDGKDVAQHRAAEELDKHSISLLSQFTYLLEEADSNYRYKAECIADDITDLAERKTKASSSG